MINKMYHTEFVITEYFIKNLAPVIASTARQSMRCCLIVIYTMVDDSGLSQSLRFFAMTVSRLFIKYSVNIASVEYIV